MAVNFLGGASNVKALVFDCDGTLLSTMEAHWEAWNFVTTKYGIKFDKYGLHKRAGRPGISIMEDLLREQGRTDLDADSIVREKVAYYDDQNLLDAVDVIAPVVSILKRAHAQGLKVGVVSGGTRHHVVDGLKGKGLYPLVESCIVTANDILELGLKGKPAPDGFLRAAELLGVEPGECIGYEDADLGMEAIVRAGYFAAVDVRHMPGHPEYEERAAKQAVAAQ
ncbi:unnamed protein product [Pedinophyceae sp. YPF-701]|nr:unnamed protein product [Pedinophyceae sp. YPF-701]